jgi:hypothetical protein
MTSTYYEADIADLISRYRYLRLADPVLESFFASMLSRAERYGKWVPEHDRVACQYLEDIYRLKRDSEAVDASLLSDLVSLGWRGIAVAALLAIFKPNEEYTTIFEPLTHLDHVQRYHWNIVKLAIRRCTGTSVDGDIVLDPLLRAVERLEALMRAYPVIDAPRLRLVPTQNELTTMSDEKKRVRDAYQGGRIAEALALANSGVLAKYR